MLEQSAATYADVAGACFPGERATYSEVLASSVEAAQRLAALGVKRGQTVGILVPGNLEHLAILLGVMRIGAVAVPISSRYKTHELDYVVRHSQMVVLLADRSNVPLLDDTGIETCDVVLIDEGDRWTAAAEGADPALAQTLADAVEDGDAALMLYTSGTTSSPKGAVHTHDSLVTQGEHVGHRIELAVGGTFWTPLPMYHSGGIVTMIASFGVGATFCHVGHFEAGLALDQLESERVTHAFPAFETIWLGVLDHPRFAEADLSALKVVINIGVRERMKAMQERVPQAVQFSCFGSTESLGFMCIGSPHDPLESRLTTSGVILSHMEMRVVDLDSGEDCEPGEPGECWFRGRSRFSHYHNDPGYTAEVIDEDGWAKTGDLIVRSAEGYVSFVGRFKDMLKVGGENVSAAEIENFLAAHPAVRMVQVVSAPDARYTEVAAAFVELQPGAQATEQELIDFCLGRIATFKVPRYVRFTETWPMSGTKVQKFKLRELIAADLQAQGITEAPRLRTGAAT